LLTQVNGQATSGGVAGNAAAVYAAADDGDIVDVVRQVRPREFLDIRFAGNRPRRILIGARQANEKPSRGRVGSRPGDGIRNAEKP
jgi:hypothetical protein